MRTPRRSLSRASSIGFGALFLGLSYACSERVVAPTATDRANEFAVSGILSSSLWRVNGSQLTYAGSVTAPARITQDKNGLRQEIGAATSTGDRLTPPPASTQRFGTSQLRAPSTNKLALPEGAQVSWRTQFKSPRMNLSTRDGKRVSIQRVADPRGGGRPPVATMLFDGDRPVSMIQAVYERDGKRWTPTRSRITVFDKDGQPSFVTENDLTALRTASVAMPGTAAALADGFRRVGGSLSKLIQPDALYAATAEDDDGEGRCLREAAYLAAAAVAQAGASVSLGVALAACAASGGVLCPAVVAAAAAVAATSIVYLARVYDYDQCMNPPTQTPISRAGSSGGGEGGSCYDIYWEISYDGGWTWEFLETQQVCGGGYDT